MDTGMPSGGGAPILVDEYVRLIGAVIRQGVKEEGSEYLRTCGGYYWCGMVGIDPVATWEKAAQRA